MFLQAKNLQYKVVEITPGIGQINVFKLSGQRQVPVLKDGETIVSDSSEIIQYIETITNEPELLPKKPHEAAMAHLIEDWADTTLAKAARLELIKAAAIDPSLRKALLPNDLPNSFKGLIDNLPCEFMNGLTEVLNQGQSTALLNSLEKLSNSVSSQPWLVGDSLSIADIAVAAQLSLLRFPFSSGESLFGKGCLGFADNPRLDPLFTWRDQLEKKLIETDPAIL
ncbi:Glutathione S-transferase protein [Prochlorococcus marinus str. SS51]|nr:Glutathione S-transferase protein [Prochlorococcus marinus str. LG]KGG22764.1 Glutathione S-transferase protein [Prochlorococcus marinus str. SS35]KGG32641.1 Glutathione S-transferase protein [Prochlorococcus marinus str. SS51]